MAEQQTLVPLVGEIVSHIDDVVREVVRPAPGKESGAVFSQDRSCRLCLWREWDQDLPLVTFIMLNPSTAGAVGNDQTIRKCIAYAQRWGMGSLEVVNVYPHISTDPRRLKRDLLRVRNLNYVFSAVGRAVRVVVAWGQHAYPEDVSRIHLELAEAGQRVVALRRNKNGSPSHPLYLPLDIEPVPYP